MADDLPTEVAGPRPAVRNDNLLDQTDQAGFARWGSATHADPGLLAGNGRLFYAVILLLAAGADFSAFLQVVDLLLSDQPEKYALLMVTGFTASALGLPHFAGTLTRDAKAGAAWANRRVAVVLVIIWLLLGLVAAFARWKLAGADSTSGSSSGHGPLDPGDSGSSDAISSSPLLLAVCFLALYLGTGMVAMVGGYLSHNPLRSGFRAGRHAHRRAGERFAASSAQLVAAQAEERLESDLLEAAARRHRAALAARLALSESLKQRARVLLARDTTDPAVTNTQCEDDQRPYNRQNPDLIDPLTTNTNDTHRDEDPPSLE